MSERKQPPNPGRRRFLGDFLANLGREAGLLAKEARKAAREVDAALEESDPAKPESPPDEILTSPDMDEASLDAQTDDSGSSQAVLEAQIAHLREVTAQAQSLDAETQALLYQVLEQLAELCAEVVTLQPIKNEVAPADTVAEETVNEPEDERSVPERRRQRALDLIWKLITALLGGKELVNAVRESIVSDDVMPWVKEQLYLIFAGAEAAGVIERSPLPTPPPSPLPGPTAESPHPPTPPTHETETPTPLGRSATGEGRSTSRRRGRVLVPEMVTVPAGHFWMGSDKRVDREARDNETPQHRLYLPAYAIGKYPVTNDEYAAFLDATGHGTPLEWAERRAKGDHPVVGVSWNDALAYCRWLSAETGRTYRLPSEAE